MWWLCAWWIKTKRDFSKWWKRVKHSLNYLPQKWWEDLAKEGNGKCLCFEPSVTLLIISQFVFYDGVPGSTLEPMWISKLCTRKDLISSLRKHLILGPVVGKPIPVASKITSKTKQAGRNHPDTWVTEARWGTLTPSFSLRRTLYCLH